MVPAATLNQIADTANVSPTVRATPVLVSKVGKATHAQRELAAMKTPVASTGNALPTVRSTRVRAPRAGEVMPARNVLLVALEIHVGSTEIAWPMVEVTLVTVT